MGILERMYEGRDSQNPPPVHPHEGETGIRELLASLNYLWKPQLIFEEDILERA